VNWLDRSLQRLQDAEDAARRIARRLEADGIPYALGGDLALETHDCPIWRALVEVVTTEAGLRAIRERLVGSGYSYFTERGEHRLRDDSSEATIEVTIGEVCAQISADGDRIMRLSKLIELRLFSAGTVPHRYLRDLGDVQTLIQTYKLPREIGDEIDESVRDVYYSNWDLSQNAWHPSNE
jgi:hypothetical protein